MVAATTPVIEERDRPGWPVLVAFLVAATVVGLVARTTRVEGTPLAAAWPSAGIAVLWLLVRRASPISVDTALLAGTMFSFGVLLDIPVWQALLLSFAHALQAIVVVVLLRLALPELWGCGGTHAIVSPPRLARYFACAGTGVLVSTVVGVSGWRLAGEPGGILDACLWFGRNACGILLVTTAGQLLFQRFSQPRPRPRLWNGSGWELGAACGTSAGLYLLVFFGDVHSMLFLTLGVVIWFGVRFGTLTSALHMLVIGYLAVWATIGGTGPFAHDEPIKNALLVQVFVIATAATGLALSTGLDERNTLTAELQQTSSEMTYQAQLLHAVVNSMAEGLAVVDDSGRWLLRNPAATGVGGLAGDLRTLLAHAPGDQDPLALALSGKTVRDREIRISDPPGAGRILAVSAAPLPRDSVTGRARALLIFRDATVEHARRVDLTAFADVVAHDLRNPLAAVESWTEMMADELSTGEVDPELVRRYIDRVGSGAHRMKGLIEDLLDRATNNSALRLRRFDVTALAREVALEHGANGHVSVDRIPEVLGDPALVRQVLDNLVGNSLKFVELDTQPRVTVTGRSTGAGTVAIAVSDEGIGLPPGTHDQVFEERHRAHPSYDGRGLGLAICRRIVERHGGAIGARDNPGGRGTVVEFTLPSPD